MNNNLIEKLIKLDKETCPEFTYSNPLLDRDVTKALSKSLVKILTGNDESIFRQQNVKKSMLETIRTMCTSAPEGHIEIDEDLTDVLTSFYDKELRESSVPNCDVDHVDKQLDAFLIKKSKAISLNSSFQSTMNPEVLQAMLNLNQYVFLPDTITKDVLYWNVDDDQKLKTVLQNLWNKEEINTPCFYDNVSMKIKSKIEHVLLNNLHRVFENRTTENVWSTESDLKSLVNACSISAECFQICISILNSLFILTNFNTSIECFIYFFIQNIKLKSKVTISILYPVYLSNLVTILDFNLDELSNSNTLKDNYTNIAKKYLQTLHKHSENDLIMLLSHYPQWFEIYFNQ